MEIKLRMGKGGRLVLPVKLREALHIEAGEVLVAQLEKDSIRLIPLHQAVILAQQAVRKYVPEGVSLVDELLKARQEEVIAMNATKSVIVTHKAILLTINKYYRPNMTPLELYETTRGIWRVGTRRYKAEYAFSLYKGTVLEVYRIDQWYPAGTLEYHTRDSSGFRTSGRLEFSGEVARDIRGQYVDFFVGKAGQNPVRYKNI